MSIKQLKTIIPHIKGFFNLKNKKLNICHLKYVIFVYYLMSGADKCVGKIKKICL